MTDIKEIKDILSTVISVLTEIDVIVSIRTMKLKPVAERFVLHWGEMGTTWGVNRTVAQIHALLFVVGKPMNAEEISEVLGVARSNVSNSVRELQSWKLIRVVHELGDRRDYFETITDVWDLFRVVVEERKKREFDPTINVLQECIDSPEFKDEDKDAQKRIKETMVLMETVSSWSEQMLKLKPETLVKVLKLGSKVQGFLGKSKEK